MVPLLKPLQNIIQFYRRPKRNVAVPKNRAKTLGHGNADP